MTDRERTLELLTRIVAANEGADPGCTARECLVAMEGLGYRLTEARPAAEWKLHGTASAPPADLLRNLRSDLEAKAERAAVARAAVEKKATERSRSDVS